MKKTENIILALDVDTIGMAAYFLNRLRPAIKIFKVGPVLFTAYGPKIIQLILKKKAEVFLDLKFHDIPNTVSAAIRQAVRLKVRMLTLHIAGGQEMLEAAVVAAKDESKKLKRKPPLLLGITVLTSAAKETNTSRLVLERARLAKKSGLDGIVCSAHEASLVRKACGKDFIIVTPGIRPKGSKIGDQKRVATASEAFKAGADYIVIGRPVLEAKDPLKAAEDIL